MLNFLITISYFIDFIEKRMFALTSLLQVATDVGLINSLGSLGLGAIISVLMIKWKMDSEKQYNALIKEMTDKFANALTEAQRKSDTTLKEFSDRQYQFEIKALDIISANIVTQKELTKAVETSGSVLSVEKQIRELEERLARK